MTMPDLRIAEAARMKITRIVCPAAGDAHLPQMDGVEVVRVRSVREAIEACLS